MAECCDDDCASLASEELPAPHQDAAQGASAGAVVRDCEAYVEGKELAYLEQLRGALVEGNVEELLRSLRRGERAGLPGAAARSAGRGERGGAIAKPTSRGKSWLTWSSCAERWSRGTWRSYCEAYVEGKELAYLEQLRGALVEG